MDDETLIAAVAVGDSAALRELFDRHAPWVAARLRRALPVDAVEDVLQETFIAAWRGATAAKAPSARGCGASRGGRPPYGHGRTVALTRVCRSTPTP